MDKQFWQSLGFPEQPDADAMLMIGVVCIVAVVGLLGFLIAQSFGL